jgi:hypothetical protein
VSSIVSVKKLVGVEARAILEKVKASTPKSAARPNFRPVPRGA